MDGKALILTISVARTIKIVMSLLLIAVVSTLLMRLNQDFVFFGDSVLEPFFDFDRENSFPTWLASTLLFSCAILLLIIGKYERERKQLYSNYWTGLGCVFVLLSIDEIATVHESLGGPFREWFDLSGALYYAWVLPVSFIIIALVLIFLRFFISLPKKFKRTISLAAILFIGGALGLEMVEGNLAYLDEANKSGLPYFLITLTEELLEFAGVSVFLYALLNYLRSSGCSVSIDLR